MPKLIKHTLVLALVFAVLAPLVGCSCCGKKQAGDWQDKVESQLPVMGHRNFIVIADSAYPLQSSPGITTFYTGQGQVQTVEEVLAMIEDADHVNPIIYVDAEMATVTEADAPGIDAYRTELNALLAGRPVQRLGHMQIIEKLDASAELFNVLILKTDLTLPYTSVFIELDCGYWDGEREQRLRDALGE